MRLGPLRHFGGFEGLYDAGGHVVMTETTRAILESHASAFAFEILRRHAPAGLVPEIDEFIGRHRRGLYRTVETIAESLDEPVDFDLGAILRLGDFALDGKLFDIRTIVPPEDFVEQAMPYARYRRSIQEIPRVRDAMRRVKRADLSLEQQVEVLINVHGDDRGLLTLDEKDVLKAQDIQFRAESRGVEEWLEDCEQSRPLSDAGTVIRREVARTSILFLQGVLSYAPDAKKFAPTLPALVKLCRLCDLPSIEYPTHFELFRCEPQDVDRHFIAFRMFVYSLATVTTLLLRAGPDRLRERSAELEARDLLGAAYLAETAGASLEQVT